MGLRRLDKNEHGKTRDLWERVFEEDSKAFLDYYYFFKTRDNEIFVLEEDGAIRSMLHLNPYTIQVEEEQFTGNYIIAVATEETYRKRGYMGQLLHKTMREMYGRKELFTFLMPAAERIYTPYDFRFVYDQNVWMYTLGKKQIKVCEEMENRVSIAEAGIGDGAALADFFNTYFAEEFQVYAVRDENYYQTMLFEQQSENGGIRLLKKDGEVVGSFLYGDEDGLEIREPLYQKAYETEFWNAVSQLCTERGQEQAAVYAGISYLDAETAKHEEGQKTVKCEVDIVRMKQTKPTIMARIIHLESLLKVLKVKKGEEIDCSFAVLDALLPQNSRVWNLQSKSLIPEAPAEKVLGGIDSDKEKKEAVEANVFEFSGDMEVRETEDSEGVLSIAALTSLLFGYKTVDEVAEEPDVYLTEHLTKELRKIQPLKKIYLNEIV